MAYIKVSPWYSVWPVLLALLLQAPTLNTKKTDEEFCHLETFNATCRAQHAVVMGLARYGRMKVGRCLNTNYHVGCYADVMSFVDSKCSGRRHCSIKVLDPQLVKLHPCRPDLMAYLEAWYTCVPVAQVSRVCPPQGYFVATSTSGHILLDYTDTSGISHCPWLIQMQPGQKVNLTLYDFNIWQRRSLDKSVSSAERVSGIHCNYRLKFLEQSKQRSVSLCQDDRRLRNVYTSKSHLVEVHIDDRFSYPEGQVFLLKYEAIGCADLQVPPNAWMKRVGPTASVSCNETKETWHLVCRDGNWIGDIGNCSNSITKLTTSSKSTMFNDIGYQFHYGILIAVGLGLVLGILMGTVMLACMMACRKRKRQRRRQALNQSAEGSLLGDSPEQHYQTAQCQSLQPREDRESLSSRMPDYGRCCNHTEMPLHHSCDMLNSKDDGPDVIYPRRITFYHVDDCEIMPNVPNMKTFKGNTYERPTISKSINDVHCCQCDAEELELKELSRDPRFFNADTGHIDTL